MSGHGIVTGTAPGMTPAYAFDCEPGSFEWTMFCNRLDCVLGAGGGISASGREVGRDSSLIEPYEKNEKTTHFKYYSTVNEVLREGASFLIR